MRMALTLALCVLLPASCVEADPVDDHSSSHVFEPKHGGTRHDLASHGPNVEILSDEKAGTIKLWIYDAHNESLAVKNPPILKIPEGPKSVKATGKDDAWTFTDDLLKKHLHGFRFTIDISTKIYNLDYDPPH